MKFFVLIFLLFSFSAGANWVKESDLKDPKTIWRLKSKCESIEGEACFDISAKDMRRWMKGQVDDLDSPKYTKEDVSACSGVENCQLNLAGKDCEADHGPGALGLINIDYTEAYCAKPNGFNQKDGLVTDPAGVTAADAEDAAKAAKDAEEAAISSVIKLQDCGRKVLAVMAIQNAPKSLSVGQKKTLINTYADIKSFLELGSMAEAKSETEAATPDGTIVTAADKAAILAKIDECLAM